MFILLYTGVASLGLCVCERERDKPLVLLLVHLHEGISVVKTAFCGTEREGIYRESVGKCKIITHNNLLMPLLETV